MLVKANYNKALQNFSKAMTNMEDLKKENNEIKFQLGKKELEDFAKISDENLLILKQSIKTSSL